MLAVSLVVAMARNHVIGRDNTLPWRLPEDLRHFKAVTLGKPVLMGRRTFESIGRPLPGRTNLVLTRDSGWKSDGVVVVHSLDEALARSKEALKEALAPPNALQELAGIGGAEVFRLLMPLASRIYLTRIDADIPGDTLFPPLDYSQWVEIDSRRFCADERNAHDMTFVTLERVRAAAR
jgi:dihydrofolate reductase